MRTLPRSAGLAVVAVSADARFEVRHEGGTLVPTADGSRVTGATGAAILMTAGQIYRVTAVR